MSEKAYDAITKRVIQKLLLSTGYCFRHFQHVFYSSGIIADKYNRLGGVIDCGLELIHIRYLSRHILHRAKRHYPTDVGQVIRDSCGIGNVNYFCGPPLAGINIEKIRVGNPGAAVRIPAIEFARNIPLPIIECKALGNSSQGFLDKMRRYFNEIICENLAASIGEEVLRLFTMNLNSCML